MNETLGSYFGLMKKSTLSFCIFIGLSMFFVYEVSAQQTQQRNAIAQFLTESLGKPISEAGMQLPVRSRKVFSGDIMDIEYGITVDGITFEYSEWGVIRMATRSLVVNIPAAGVAQLMQNFDNEAQEVITALKSEFNVNNDVSRSGGSGSGANVIVYNLNLRPNSRLVLLGTPRNNIIITITIIGGPDFVRITYSAGLV